MVLQHFLPYFIRNVLVSGTLWVSSSIDHITLERKTYGSRSGGTHPTLTKDSPTIEDNLATT
jgi:hypothetical protein